MQELVLYSQAEGPVLLPENRAASWQLMGKAKMAMDTGLTKRELAITAVLAGYNTLTLPLLTEKLAEFKRLQSDMVEFRKGFTKHMDNLIQSCMVIEKKYDPKTNVDFLNATQRELQLRTEAQNALKATQNKELEKAAVKTHVENQLNALKVNYENALLGMVNQTHRDCLAVKTPVDMVPGAIEVCKAAMLAYKFPPTTRYQVQHITEEEKLKVIKSIAVPNWQEIYNNALNQLNERFSMYANDLQAADVVINQSVIDEKAKVAESQTNLQQQQAATSLVNQASVTSMIMPTGFKQITETTKIKVVTDDPNFALFIITAFVANWQTCIVKTKVKDYTRLTVLQMCSALDAAGIKVDKVQYEDVKK